MPIIPHGGTLVNRILDVAERKSPRTKFFTSSYVMDSREAADFDMLRMIVQSINRLLSEQDYLDVSRI